MPYFEQALDVSVQASPDGDWRLALTSVTDEGLILAKQDLIALTVRSLEISREANAAELKLSGGIRPLLMSNEGLEWPELEVTDLYIDSTGKFRIKEAWLTLGKLATCDLWGFHFELHRIGLGSQEGDDKLWVDLSGSLRLMEQVPVGLGVEGFRITWPRTLAVNELPTVERALAIANALDVKFEGVHLFFGVPDAVEFEGLIRFFKNAQAAGFAGDMALRIPATGLSVEAGLLIGMNFEPPPYPMAQLMKVGVL